MYNNKRQATAHKADEMFFKFILVLFPVDTARCTFLAMMNNFKLKNINRGRNKARRIIKDNVAEITKFIREIVYMTVGTMSIIARRASSLRLVTDV